MKNLILLSVLSTLVVARAAEGDPVVTMEQLRAIGHLPADKEKMRPEDKIDKKRINPFAARVANKNPVAKTKENSESEESKIRAWFDGNRIAGSGRTRDGKRWVNIGHLNLEEGARISPIIFNQTQILRVIRITDGFVEIGWVEGGSQETGGIRKLQKRMSIEPQVAVALPDSGSDKKDEVRFYYSDASGKPISPKQDLLSEDDDEHTTGITTALTADERNSITEAEKAAQSDTAVAPAPEPEIVPEVEKTEAPPAPEADALGEAPPVPEEPAALPDAPPALDQAAVSQPELPATPPTGLPE